MTPSLTLDADRAIELAASLTQARDDLERVRRELFATQELLAAAITHLQHVDYGTDTQRRLARDLDLINRCNAWINMHDIGPADQPYHLSNPTIVDKEVR